MIPSLAFVPEEDVVDCYNILMTDFPESALNVAVYFEETYIGKRLPDNSRRIPPFPIRMWNMLKEYVRNYRELTMLLRGGTIRAANGSVTHGSMGRWVTFWGWVMGHMPWVMTHQYFDSLII